ncbi:MAG: outer membrane protein insertion porin family [Myxococcota bacterium]|jgi:outer membrane protein insertion porin family
MNLRPLIRTLAPLALIIALLAPWCAFGQEKAPKVVSIEVEGLLRIPEESVRAKLQTRVGARLSRAIVSDDIERIYQMGAFKDIRVAERGTDDGVIIRYIVVERPTLARIQYQGHDELEEDDIKKVVDARAFEIVDEVLIKRIVSKIRNLYVDEGYFLADVRYVLVDRPNNTVDLVFHITEGKKVKVTSITLVGNTKLTDDDVKRVLRTQEGGWFSFLTSSGQFKKEALELDLQLIRQYYLHKGFVDVKVHQAAVTLSSDKSSIDITIPIEEGEKYSMKMVDVEEVGAPKDDDGKAQMLFEKSLLMSKLKLQAGMTFDAMLMQRDSTSLKELYQDLGFANVTVSNASYRDPDSRTIEFTYKIQKGSKISIGRIEFAGNESTRDKVMRRVMKIDEGDLYSASKIGASRRQITRLGFFDSVDITSNPGDDPEHVNLVVRVKERQTGTFQVGAGFSSLENFIATAQISKQNFMGHGQTVSIQATISSIRSLYTLSFFEPYFLDSDWTLSLDLYNFQQDFNDFTRASTGGSMAWGYRLTDDLHVSLTYKLESVEATAGGISSTAAVPIYNLSGTEDGASLTSSLKATLTFDTRDDRQFPKSGQFTTMSAEVAHNYLGSDTQYNRFAARTRWYFNPFWKFVLKLNGTVGYIFGNEIPVPIYERFFVGGIFDVRGFARNSLGPSVSVPRRREPGATTTDFTTGGNMELIFNVELEFPIVEAVGIRGVLFFDAGNAYGNDEIDEHVFEKLRPAIGWGIRWQSPVGPLRFEWGIPLKPLPNEEPLVFEFTIGNSF